jgi:glutathione S-transferase
MSMAKITLWGFSGSTYVRTVRMVLAEKGVTDYEQVPVDVLKGEPKQAEHLARHPFGKVPVVEVDGFRVIETSAITRYLDAVLPGTSLIPSAAEDRARMDMVMSIIDSYGYGAILGGVVAYHLFPEFVGGKNEQAHRSGLERGHETMRALAGIRGGSSFFAGDRISLADLYLAPVMAYIALTPHADEFLETPEMSDWWKRMAETESFRSTQP